MTAPLRPRCRGAGGMSPRPVSNRLSWLRGVPCRPCVLPGVLPGLLLFIVIGLMAGMFGLGAGW
ncbi:hypothetical protein EKK70_17655, partial [Desulfovibrio sp. DS-1]